MAALEIPPLNSARGTENEDSAEILGECVSEGAYCIFEGAAAYKRNLLMQDSIPFAVQSRLTGGGRRFSQTRSVVILRE